jgi:hypothetical protein
VASTTARTQAREQILQLCRGDAGARTLRLEVLAVLRRVIGFDAYVWLVTDPETSVGSAPLADVPCLPELPRLIRLKYLTTVNRWTSMITPVASLHQATGGDLARSLMWRDLLCRYQITDIAASVHRDRFGCWAFLDLWRMQPAPPFAAADLEFLHSVAGPLATALRHSQGDGFRSRPRWRAGQRGPGRAAALTRTRRAGPDPADPGVPAAAHPAGRGCSSRRTRRLRLRSRPAPATWARSCSPGKQAWTATRRSPASTWAAATG